METLTSSTLSEEHSANVKEKLDAATWKLEKSGCPVDEATRTWMAGKCQSGSLEMRDYGRKEAGATRLRMLVCGHSRPLLGDRTSDAGSLGLPSPA